MKRISRLLAEKSVTCSAPCRIDMAGTLDLSTFFYPLAHLEPVTFNIALDMRTRVRLAAYRQGQVRVASRGFETAVFESGQAPFSHELGLIFAVAASFNASGVSIEIDSGSPPRAGLGGSSAAAVALVAAFYSLLGRNIEANRAEIALYAHAIEQSVAGVPCGLQDQLAAAFGGVNAWLWRGTRPERPFRRLAMTADPAGCDLQESILVAYCGIAHESKNINGKWVAGFLAGENRHIWHEIIMAGQGFVKALNRGDLNAAAEWMNLETELRCQLTPEVLEDTGYEFVKTAVQAGCGARFTGAGAGGCVWALGKKEDIGLLKGKWQSIAAGRPGARLLAAGITNRGVLLS